MKPDRRNLRRLRKGLRQWMGALVDKCFPDAAEVRLLEVLGGTTLTIGAIQRGGRTCTLILSKGRLLRSERFRRVAADSRMVLWMNDVGQILAVQGRDYEHDIVKYFEADEALKQQGFRVQWLPELWLEKMPTRALRAVQNFVYY